MELSVVSTGFKPSSFWRGRAQGAERRNYCTDKNTAFADVKQRYLCIFLIDKN